MCVGTNASKLVEVKGDRKVGSLLVETHLMPDDWVVRYVSNGLGRAWML